MVNINEDTDREREGRSMNKIEKKRKAKKFEKEIKTGIKGEKEREDGEERHVHV